MDYREFVETMEEKAQQELGEDIRIERTEKLKNNGVKKEALMASHGMTPVSPVVYLPEMYEAYQRGMDIDECARRAADMIRDGMCDDQMAEKLVAGIRSWEKSRGKLCVFLLARRENTELLEELVYRSFLDLAVCYAVCLSDGTEGTASIRVAHRMLEVWGVAEEELYEQALQNMEDDGYQLLEIQEILAGLGFSMEDIREDIPFLFTMLTNRRKLFGAAGILKPGLLEGFAAQTGANLFLLPSSIHEMLLIPDDGHSTVEELNEMIRTTNETQVMPEERLSDHAYYYDRELREVRIVG